MIYIIVLLIVYYLIIGAYKASKLLQDLNQEEQNLLLAVENDFVNVDTKQSNIGLFITIMIIWPFINDLTIE